MIVSCCSAKHTRTKPFGLHRKEKPLYSSVKFEYFMLKPLKSLAGDDVGNAKLSSRVNQKSFGETFDSRALLGNRPQPLSFTKESLSFRRHIQLSLVFLLLLQSDADTHSMYR